jgi:hypothetical protein
MRALLDTNIIIHREASTVRNKDIGILFQWLDKLHHTKCVHPITVRELQKHLDIKTVQSMEIKLSSYHQLKTEAPFDENVKAVSSKIDLSENDINDSRILNEVYLGRVDFLISEDKKIHTKAKMLGLSDRVFRIDGYLEKISRENPDLVDYKVLAVRKVHFGDINLKDTFFDSFRQDYEGFDKWFAKKSDELAYVCYQADQLSAFLFIKIEDEKENYGDIIPAFSRKKRLKIGTLKVTSNGFKLGERFLKLIFDNARLYKVDEIYVTIFDKRPEQKRLITLLEDWGFKLHGNKLGNSGEERVYVRDFSKGANSQMPKFTFPWLSRDNKVFIVPIYPEYHTELFPDSILRTESPLDFIENEPHRNALSKVYVSHSRERGLSRGDTIIFYRTGGIYAGVATTIGIVESIHDNLESADELVHYCRKRTVLNDDALKTFWNRYRDNKPFVVNFLYAFSFKKRPNLKQLNELGIIPNIHDMPRGFREVEMEHLITLIKTFGI